MKRTRVHMLWLILVVACQVSVVEPVRGEASLTPLEERVRRALVSLPYYSVFDNLEFRVEGTQVILSGQVTRPTLKSGAENVAGRVEDIESVENNIEVLPLSSMDDQIRMAVYGAIYYHPVFTRYAIQAVPPIHIIVKNGHVTLVGAVASEADKQLANMRANQVPGVFSVVNNLQVD